MKKTNSTTQLSFKITGLIALMFLAFSITGFAQTKKVSGTITDETGNPLIGVTVLVQGTATGVLSDDAGNYEIEAAEGNSLFFSMVAFQNELVTIGSANTINVTMKFSTLEEVVVTGYSVQRKKDVTGSVSVIKPVELTAVPTGNVSNQLQGRAAGVNVVQDGRPGSPSKVRIRGFGSFQANDPLYVVDGVPTLDISTLNPNDVATLTVLKDAGAASIYGSRASNGVIVITTKRGSEQVKVNYSAYVGMQDPGSGPTNLLSTQGYADLQWLVYDNDGTTEEHPVYGSSTNANPTLPSWAANTNWWDEMTRTALIMNHDVSLSGGNKNSKFYGGFSYFSQDGVVIETESKRFTGRFNSEFNIKDRVTVGENISFSHTSRTRGTADLEEAAPINAVYRTQSIIPVRTTTNIEGLSHNFVPGDYGGTGLAPRLGNGGNPIADAERDANDFGFDFRLLGSVYADVKIAEGLNFRSTFGGTFGMGYYNDYTFSTYENSENVATAAFQEGSNYGGDWVWTNTVTFDRDFGAHSILAVAGYEAVKFGMGRGVFGRRAGYFSDAVSFRTLDNGANIVNASSYNATPTTLNSNFLRLDYGYDNKYLLSATIRRDASSKFGADFRTGIFPSVTAAWRVSQEGFLADNAIISNLKIRGGYGTMGNQQPLDPANAFFLFGGSTNTSNYDLNGAGNSSLQGFRPTRIGNANAKWETNITTNIGFDAAFFDNRLEVVFDYYTKVNDDLLFNPELPGTAGAATQPFVNIAKMSNKGIDLQMIYRDNFGSDLSFEGNFTFTTYKNEILKIADGFDFFDWGGSRIGGFNRNIVGRSLSEFYGYQVVGLFASDADAANAPTQDGAEAGFFQYADIAGPNDAEGNPTGPDGVIDDNDRTFIGNPNPDFTYGLNLMLKYKNFDFTAFLYGSQGGEIFNYTKWWVDFWPSFQGQKSTDLLNNSWTPTNTSATVPKASNKSNFSTNTVSSSYYIEDGSFVRLKNVQLGYNIPTDLANKVGMGSFRIYLQATNLFTLTKYSGVDPELGGDDRSFGVDAGTYPVVKQYLVGVNFGF